MSSRREFLEFIAGSACASMQMDCTPIEECVIGMVMHIKQPVSEHVANTIAIQCEAFNKHLKSLGHKQVAFMLVDESKLHIEKVQ